MYFDSIAKIIAQRTGCSVKDITPESRFSDLGIDSLDTVELLMNLEDEIGQEIDIEEKVETVGELDRLIQEKVKKA
ncbi:MAG: acyl carrier protein [Lachnospira sp.]|nr:acyl carrier protein [Lachnospira sp.]